MTAFEQFQKEISKNKNERRPIKYGRRLKYTITKDRLHYLFNTYFIPMFFEEDYISYYYREQDLAALLVILRHHFKVWIEFDESANFLNVYRTFPQAFKVIREVNRQNHWFVPETIKKGTILHLVKDNYGTVNWLNGIPLTKKLKPADEQDESTFTQINYDYIIPF